MRTLFVLLFVGCAGSAPAPRKPPVVFASLTGSPSNQDKRIIRRHVHTRQPQITACYEAELQKQPGLEGTVTVTFLIEGTTGHVASVNASGVDETVDRCIENEFRQIGFPTTDTGGDVTVDAYPITFKMSSQR